MKTCSECAAEYEKDSPKKKSGLCPPCAKARTAKQKRDWHDKNPTYSKLYDRIYYIENKSSKKAGMRDWVERNPERVMLLSAKARAKEKGLPFDLLIEDIQIPEMCPILGLKLQRSGSRREENSPTLDRVLPALGYVRGNVRVVSWRANRLKNDATPEEIEALYFDSQRQKIRRVS